MSTFNFETSFMRSVKNNVYISIYYRIVDMLEEANFEHEHMSDIIGLMKRHNITFEMLRREKKHYDTPEIQNQHKKRRQMLASLRDVIDRLPKMPGYASEENIHQLQLWMKKHREQIGSRNVVDEMLAAYSIEMSIGRPTYIREALEEANLLKLAEGLVELNNEIVNMELTRHEDNEAATLKYDRKIASYDDMNTVLHTLVGVAKLGKEDSVLATAVFENVNALLRRERGYVRMVETKKRMKGEGEGQEDLGESAEVDTEIAAADNEDVKHEDMNEQEKETGINKAESEEDH